jgi:hypothetical protein
MLCFVTPGGRGLRVERIARVLQRLHQVKVEPTGTWMTNIFLFFGCVGNLTTVWVMARLTFGPEPKKMTIFII